VKSLGRFHLMGIPPAPRGMPQIEVAFDIDANGIVNVSAKDLATGKEQQMTITGGTALGKDEVERMVADAEKFAAEDHQRREAAEARNHADQVAYQIERFLQDDGDKIADGDKADLTKAKDDLQAVLKDEAATPEALSSAADAAMQVFQRVGQAMVQQQQAAQAAQQTTTPEGGEGAGDAGAATESEDDVVEGEIVDEGEAS
jgi:molecular chaperone DnaK